jgi:hypothetical protein
MNHYNDNVPVQLKSSVKKDAIVVPICRRSNDFRLISAIYCRANGFASQVYQFCGLVPDSRTIYTVTLNQTNQRVLPR